MGVLYQRGTPVMGGMAGRQTEQGEARFWRCSDAADMVIREKVLES